MRSLDYHNKAYMKLLSVDNKKSPITAKIELDCEVKGTIKRKAVTVRQGDDLSEKLSGYREVYNGYVVDDIYCEKGNEYVSFTTKPEILRIGEPWATLMIGPSKSSRSARPSRGT